MKLEQSFTVDAPPERVWQALVDVERVAPCLPGAQVTGKDDEGTYQGAFTVKIGPTTAAYTGTLKMEQIDEAARTAVMSARGTDKRGQGGANAMIRSTVTEDAGRTKVDVVTDFTITGRLARFGRGGMIEDVSKRLLRDFASCLEATVGSEAGEPVAAASAGGVDAGGAGRAVERTAAEATAAGTTADPVPGAGMAAGEVRRVPPGGPAGAPEPAPTPPSPEDAGAPAPARRAPAAPQPAKPLNAFSLLWSVLWERIARLFGRGRR